MSEVLNAAEARLRTLSARPSNEELLELYALYKQALLGNNLQPKPGMFDVKGQFKWKAWKDKAGMAQDVATAKYVALVDSLLEKHG
ncbi:MAG: acyl-CoA-binding protein [Flavobacteriales bacterium]|nr:acyl-CoA-binding protein [Flavobacteriales bacterium]